MLYPIELLGQMTVAPFTGVATDGVHVNGQGEFCHVVRQLFASRFLHQSGEPYGWVSGLRTVPSCKMHYSK